MKAANSNNPKGPDICPVCKKSPTAAKFQPFCSARCADVDLGRWLKGNYMIPGEKAEPSDMDPDD